MRTDTATCSVVGSDSVFTTSRPFVTHPTRSMISKHVSVRWLFVQRHMSAKITPSLASLFGFVRFTTSPMEVWVKALARNPAGQLRTGDAAIKRRSKAPSLAAIVPPALGLALGVVVIYRLPSRHAPAVVDLGAARAGASHPCRFVLCVRRASMDRPGRVEQGGPAPPLADADTSAASQGIKINYTTAVFGAAVRVGDPCSRS
jgi:hypothetical protein